MAADEKAKPEYIWPTGGRRVVGLLSVIGVFGFGAAIVYVAYIKGGYLTYLTLTFFWFLSLFHAGYAYTQGLTQRRVRKIDYWYLGAATLGMLLFALGVTNQREVIVGRSLDMIYKEQARIEGETVTSRASAYKAFMCDQETVKLTKAPCDHATDILKAVQGDLTLQKVKDLESTFDKINIKDLVDIRRRRDAAKLEPGGGSTDPLLITSVELKMALQKWLGWRILTPPPEAPAKQFDETAELMLGIGQMIVWPFLLAFALALRIAKVTVDVFEWAGG
jgi:hypothetical protein